MPRSRAKKADVRTLALDAATALIGQHGFEAVAVQDVAEQVGVSKQALLYHFKNKEALKLAVIDYLLERSNKSLTELLGSLPIEEDQRLDGILEHLNRFLTAEPYAAAVFFRFLLDGDVTATDRIRAGARPWFKFIEDAVRRARTDGQLRPELDPEETVLQVGMLVLANFALLPVGGWTKKALGAAARAKRLRELVKAIGFILFEDGSRKL